MLLFPGIFVFPPRSLRARLTAGSTATRHDALQGTRRRRPIRWALGEPAHEPIGEQHDAPPDEDGGQEEQPEWPPQPAFHVVASPCVLLAASAATALRRSPTASSAS